MNKSLTIIGVILIIGYASHEIYTDYKTKHPTAIPIELSVASADNKLAKNQEEKPEPVGEPESSLLPENRKFPVVESPKRIIVQDSPPEIKNTLEDGKFILLVYKSISKDDGIKGLPPGTMLNKPTGKDYFLTPDGDKLFLIEQEYTNDLDAAKKYISADRMTQIRVKSVTPVPAVQTSTPVPQDNTPVQNTNNSGGYVNPLGIGGHNKISSQSSIRTDEMGRKYRIINGKVVYLDK